MITEPQKHQFLRAENNIFLDGEKIGSIDETGTLKMRPGTTKANKKAALEWLKSASTTAPAATSTKPTEEPDKQERQALGNSMAGKPPESITTAPITKGEIPPCPPMDPLAGDKTPAVIDWYERYHPEEFKRRYANRRFSREPISQ